MSISQVAVDRVSATFLTSNITLSTYVLALLEDPRFESDTCTLDLISQAHEIILAFSRHPKTHDSSLVWASNIMKKKYSESIKLLVSVKDSNRNDVLVMLEDSLHNTYLPETWSVAEALLNGVSYLAQ